MKRTLAALTALLLLVGSLFAFDTRSEPTFPDGTPIQLELPPGQHMMNVGGSDGSGLCVYTSVTLAARYQNAVEAYNLRKFAEGRPGGSDPEKLDADLKAYSTRYGVVLPSYVQHTGGDDAFLDLCVKTGRMPGITYAGKDDFYDSPILHMVNLAHLDATRGAIQDNNRAGKWTSDTRSRIVNRWKGLDDNGKDLLVPACQGLRTVWIPAGGGWAFVWLTPPPPPKPKTAADEPAKPTERAACGCWEKTVDETDGKIAWTYWSNGEPVYRVVDGVWYVPGADDKWIEKPGDPPPGMSVPENNPQDDWNKGVDSWKFDRRNRYWINGVEVSQAKAYAAVADPQAAGLVDDSDKYHLTFVDVDKKTVASWFASNGPLEKYARRVHVQVYTKADWPAARVPTKLTLQEPSKIGGRVVGSTDTVTLESTRKTLADVFDPPPPVTPVPPAPKIDPLPVTPVVPAAEPVVPDPKSDRPFITLLIALATIAVLVLKRSK